MPIALMLLADLLWHAGTYTIAAEGDPQSRPRAMDNAPLRHRASQLQSQLAQLRHLLSRHELKLRVTGAARKQLFMLVDDEHDPRQVVESQVCRPLAEMIQAGAVRATDTIVAHCITDEITLRIL